MKLRTGFAIASALGVLIFVPVLVVVALGLYGESIGGDRSAGSQAELGVSPNRAFLDSHVRIEGRKWPPRVEIKVRLSREGSAGFQRVTEIPLASVVSSRSGAFAIELALPALFISNDARQLSLRAAAVGRDGRPLASAAAKFTIAPYKNTVEALVSDAESGMPLAGARVQLRDGFGRIVAVRPSDASGMVRFAGLTPGDAVIDASRVDYSRARVNLSAPRDGLIWVAVSLTADPGKRLILPFTEMTSEGRPQVTAVDRASGLRADRIFVDDLTPRPSFPSEIQFFHLYSVSRDHKTETAGPAPPSVRTMRSWGHRLAARLPAIVARARLLGMSASGDVVVVAEASGAGFGQSMTRWFLLDAETGQEKTRGELAQGRFVSGMSPDRRGVYVVDNVRNRLEVVGVERGDVTASVDGIPATVLRVSPDPSGSAVYLLEGGTGRVFRADLAARRVSGPIVSVRGATWISTDATGSRLYVVGSRLNTMTVVNDPGGAPWVATVPLPAAVGWIWVDRDGPYTYAGRRSGGDVLVLNSESLQFVERLQASNPNTPGSGGNP